MVQLLHEIGHITITGTEAVTTVIEVGKGKGKQKRSYQQFKFTTLLKSDTGDPYLSGENTDKIIAACENQIKELDQKR